jgi:hypothetical protein
VIFIVIGIVGGVLIALDAQRNLRVGSAATLFGTFSRQDHPARFRTIWVSKLLMSVTSLALAAVLIVRNFA